MKVRYNSMEVMPMRRRGLPISYLGAIIALLAFIIWYGWRTQIAPYQAEMRAQQEQKQTAQPAPSEAEVKQMLQQNKAAAEAQPKPSTAQPTPPKPSAVQPHKPDPTREVVEYWWEQVPVETEKR